jgi:ribosomal protein L44E
MQHYTRNTISVSALCKKCGKYTQHRVDDTRLGPCLGCIERLEAGHGAAPRVEVETQAEMFASIDPRFV